MTSPSKLGGTRADVSSVAVAAVPSPRRSGAVADGSWVCSCGRGFEFLTGLRLHELADGCGAA